MNETDIKNLIKNHLKVKIDQANPHNFSNGYIKVGIYWDNELIDEHTQIISRSFF